MMLEYHPLRFRHAVRNDLRQIISMLLEDDLGMQREATDPETMKKYDEAFEQMSRQTDNVILLGETDTEVVAMLQLTIIPGLSHQGSQRAQIESVRVKQNMRGKGYGTQLFKKVVEIAKAKNCAIVQLSTDIRRKDAIRFYESLGFEATHYGMKMRI